MARDRGRLVYHTRESLVPETGTDVHEFGHLGDFGLCEGCKLTPSGLVTLLPDIWYDPLSLLPHGPQRAVAHAKCVVADNRYLFVSSANFTEASQNRNLEAGVLVESTTLAAKMVEFLEGLIREQRVRKARSNVGSNT